MTHPIPRVLACGQHLLSKTGTVFRVTCARKYGNTRKYKLVGPGGTTSPAYTRKFLVEIGCLLWTPGQ